MRLHVDLLDEDVTVHVVEAVGVSRQSSHDAVRRAVSGALNPARHVVGVDVLERSVERCDDGEEFRVALRIAYTCDPEAPLIESTVMSDIPIPVGIGGESLRERELVPAGG